MEIINNDPPKNLPQLDAKGRPVRYSPQPRQKKIVSAMWARMTQIYGNKWTSQEGEPRQINGDDSARFILWCQKTDGLTDDQWKRGFENVEHEVRDKKRDGEIAWPPSYAEFLGLCDRDDTQKYIPEHKYFPPIGIEDKTTREKRRLLGIEKCGQLKGIFE